MRFRILTHQNGYYCVSIPNYHGSEVVDADSYDQVVRERDSLGKAIAEAAIERGIIDGTQPLTGPQLLMLCNDLAKA